MSEFIFFFDEGNLILLLNPKIKTELTNFPKNPRQNFVLILF